jgi:glycosyltransferase involved in cell wall biosynthesis
MNKGIGSEKKIKVLAFCDTPSCATGFSTVSRNIFEALYKTGRYEIEILGINFWGNPHNFPYKIWPVGTNNERDPYGRKKVFSMIPQMMDDQTILFFLQDTFILDFLPQLHEKLDADGKKRVEICYFPIDGKPKEQWLKNVNAVDYPVTYSEWGKKQVFDVYPEFNKDLMIIPHGANLKNFYVLNKKDILSFRSQFFGENRDKFIFTNVNRNQQRKDIPRTIMAFKEFQKQIPNSLLYLHMAKKDQGWDLIEVCNSMGLSTNKDVVFPESFGPNQGYPIEVVNMIYNCSDCVVSTTLGEGAGLAWLEAMATKTPVIFPNNTALTENITEDRGYLVKSGTNSSLFTIIPNDNEILRPLVDVDDMVKMMLHVYNNYDEAMERAENAYNWISMKMDWQGDIAKKWVELFDKAVEDLNKDRPIVSKEDKVIEAETV